MQTLLNNLRSRLGKLALNLKSKKPHDLCGTCSGTGQYKPNVVEVVAREMNLAAVVHQDAIHKVAVDEIVTVNIHGEIFKVLPIPDNKRHGAYLITGAITTNGDCFGTSDKALYASSSDRSQT